MAVTTAVIPVAGLGTRFLPITKALPKEMLPVIDKPILQYTIEEALNAGIERIILVTSRGKSIAEDYFDLSPELEQSLDDRNSQMLEEIQRISRMANIITVRQRQPLGLGHAILTSRSAVGDNSFVVMLADDLIRNSPSATRQLLEIYEQKEGSSVIAVENVPRQSLSGYGVIGGEAVTPKLWRVHQIVEKPDIDLAPSTMGVVGRYVLNPSIFDCLSEIGVGTIGEFQLTDAIALLIKNETQFVYALQFDGARYDCGTPLGLLKASIALSLERPELAGDLKEWLQKNT